MSRLFTRDPKGRFTKTLFKECDNVFKEFADRVIGNAKRNLSRLKKGSGKLFRSLRADVLQKQDDFVLRFWSTDYGDFVDQGVSGVKKRISGTKYSYRIKIPPPSLLEQWAKKKGIKGRNKKGRFITNKSLGFAIAKSIFNKGLPRTLFYTKAFEDNFKQDFVSKVETAYANDMERILEAEFREQLNN